MSTIMPDDLVSRLAGISLAPAQPLEYAAAVNDLCHLYLGKRRRRCTAWQDQHQRQ
jgi:hypothetical protein